MTPNDNAQKVGTPQQQLVRLAIARLRELGEWDGRKNRLEQFHETKE